MLHCTVICNLNLPKGKECVGGEGQCTYVRNDSVVRGADNRPVKARGSR